MIDQPSNPNKALQSIKAFMNWVKNIIQPNSHTVRDEIEDALDEIKDHDFSVHEKTLITNVLALHDIKAKDIQIPRADIVAVSVHSSLAEVLKLFREAGHSRLPVFGDTLDDIRGMLHIRDFVDYIASAVENDVHKKTNISSDGSGDHIAQNTQKRRFAVASLHLDSLLSDSKIIRPILYVPPSMPALDVLVKMQAMRTHMALVIDEYGGTDGLVSIEDIVETIVGNIEDEHDEDQTPVIQLVSEGVAMADGRADLADFFKIMAVSDDDVEIKEIDTISGYITSSIGYVPARGQILRIKSLEYEVLDADPRRVKRIRARHCVNDPLSQKS
jgi:CBS domain containing-hemolysin-like protein